jgi:hypothetical protein
MAEDIRQAAARAVYETENERNEEIADAVLAAVRPVLLAEGYRACQADAERAIGELPHEYGPTIFRRSIVAAIRSLAPATQPETT